MRALAAGREHPLIARMSSAQPRQVFVFPARVVIGRACRPTASRRPIGPRPTRAAAFAAAGADSPLPYLIAPPGTDERQAFCEIEIEGAQFVHAVALAGGMAFLR